MRASVCGASERRLSNLYSAPEMVKWRTMREAALPLRRAQTSNIFRH